MLNNALLLIWTNIGLVLLSSVILFIVSMKLAKIKELNRILSEILSELAAILTRRNEGEE